MATTTTTSKRRGNLESSIYFSERDQHWHGRTTRGIKPDGSPDRPHTMSRDRAKVAAKVREWERQRDAGTAQPGKAPTVAAIMSEYLTVTCPALVSGGRMSPRTWDDYQSKDRNHITPLLGAHRANRLTPSHIESWHSKLFAKELSPATVLKCHRILSRALTIAVRRGAFGRNPAELVEPPAAGDGEITPFTVAEAQAILAAATGRRNAARWSVALAIGLRQGECLGLRWSYLDLDTGVVRAWYQVGRANFRHGCDDPNACGAVWHRAPCPKTCDQHRHADDCPAGCATRGHTCPRRTCDPRTCTGHARHCPERAGGGITFRPRKGKRQLTTQIPDELLPALKAHQEIQDMERAMVGEKWADLDLVFATSTGGPISRDDDWRAWKALLRDAGVRDARLHDARHTAATLMIAQGVHTRVVQQVLGHARVTTTERYTHVASPMVVDAVSRVGSALWGSK